MLISSHRDHVMDIVGGAWCHRYPVMGKQPRLHKMECKAQNTFIRPGQLLLRSLPTPPLGVNAPDYFCSGQLGLCSSILGLLSRICGCLDIHNGHRHTTLHYNAVHCTLHCTTLHYTTLQMTVSEVIQEIAEKNTAHKSQYCRCHWA